MGRLNRFGDHTQQLVAHPMEVDLIPQSLPDGVKRSRRPGILLFPALLLLEEDMMFDQIEEQIITHDKAGSSCVP